MASLTDTTKSVHRSMQKMAGSLKKMNDEVVGTREDVLGVKYQVRGVFKEGIAPKLQGRYINLVVNCRYC